MPGWDIDEEMGSPLLAADAVRESRISTGLIMEVYRQAALRNYAEAEELMAKALDLRDAGHELLYRAEYVALEHAKLQDAYDKELCEPAW